MQTIKLGDIAIEAKESNKGDKTGCKIVGLEHLTPSDVTLSSWSEDTNNSFTKKFAKGDVLFGRRRAYLKKAALAPFDGICSGDITVIRAKEGKVDPRLLPFIIQNDFLFEFAVGKSAGSLSPRVKWEHLRNFEISLPDTDKQRELADILWSINETKQAYLELIKQTDELVKSQFIEMFGDPVQNTMGWQVMPFEDFAQIDAVMTDEYEKYANYPHIGIDSIEKNTGILSGYRTVKEDNVISGKYLFTSEHIIYSKIRPALNKVALPDFEGLCSADAYPILPKKNICDRLFLATVLRSDYFLSYILGFSTRSQMPKVNRKQISGFSMPVPPLDRQIIFADFVRQTDKSKFELQDALDNLDALSKKIIAENLIAAGKE